MKTLKHLLATLINTPLRRLGYEIGRYADSPSLHAALSRTAEKSLTINTVVDIGASDGRWSAVAHRFFPSAHYFLIEANREHEAKLRRFCNRLPRAEYVLAAAGDVVGELYFDRSDPFGGLAAHEATESHYVSVPSTTVDHEVAARQLHGPFLLKLDTHGFEEPIFRGAEQMLQETDLIVVETYNFDVAPQSLRFHEMCRFLEERGFRPVDICGLLHRPRDKSLWQFDLFFMRATHPAFSSNSYYAESAGIGQDG